jgi:hypothetical protein
VVTIVATTGGVAVVAKPATNTVGRADLPSMSQWTHVALVLSSAAGGGKLYVNSELLWSGSLQAGPPGGQGDFPADVMLLASENRAADTRAGLAAVRLWHVERTQGAGGP